MKGTPQAPRLVERGGCATGPYRTPTTLGHTTKTGRLAALPNTQKQNREAAKLRRQRNMAQMKEQIKTPEKELKEMEINNLSDTEFKTFVIRMHKELRSSTA